MEKVLTHYSTLKDHQLQKFLYSQIGRYASLKKLKRSRRRTVRNLTAVSTTAPIPRYLSPYSPAPLTHLIEPVAARPGSLRSTPKAAQMYSIEQMLTIQLSFSRLVDIYGRLGLVKKKNNENEKLSVIAVKRFFLDCYACDYRFFSIVTGPLQGCEWVSSEMFVKCFENIHQGTSWKFFPAKKIKLDTKDNFTKLKLLCNV
jgi:hypothetical protein